jgi:hypothetical protein
MAEKEVDPAFGHFELIPPHGRIVGAAADTRVRDICWAYPTRPACEAAVKA